MAQKWDEPIVPFIASIEPTAWPTLHPDALHGLAGNVTASVGEHTESDPVAVLLTYLIMFGNAAGRSAHCLVSGRRHHMNENVVLVGETSSGKGQSRDYPEQIIKRADPEWGWRIKGGIASGEGLVWAIRDPIRKADPKTGEDRIEDEGVADKRLMLFEEEYSAIMKVMGREGSIVSETQRRAWDSMPLGNLTKSSSAQCELPHCSLFAHVTPAELRSTLDDTSVANGYGNRNLWPLVRRSKFLPEGGRLPEQAIQELAGRTLGALAFARQSAEVRRTPRAVEMWAEMYPDLVSGQAGMIGALTARGAAHVLRLSLIYAMLDQAHAIDIPHISAASAIWDYNVESVRYIFGGRLGDPVADRILDALSNGPMSQHDINNLFGRNESGARLHRALQSLSASNLVASSIVEPFSNTGRGRPVTMWRRLR